VVIASAIEVRGAHAPSRAQFRRLAEMLLVQPKEVVGEAPTTAREARALPGKGKLRAPLAL